MKRYKWILIGGNLLLLLLYFNYAVCQKEQTLRQGELVLLRLAPVDPRSLMQGDYMVLDYEIARLDWEKEQGDSITPEQGYAILALDSNRVATIIRYQTDTEGLAASEQPIKYRKKDEITLKLGAESFFFEEGKGDAYSQAVYGGLRIDPFGNSVLVGLYNKDFQLIQDWMKPVEDSTMYNPEELL